MALSLPRIAIYAVVSAVAGTMLDRIHTFFGVLRQLGPTFCGESLAVPFLMSGAGVALVVLSGLFRVHFGQAADGTTRGAITFGAGFAGAYLASAAFQCWPLCLLGGYALVAALLLVRDHRPARVAIVMTAALLGTIGEILLTHFHSFEYLHPDVCGIVYWTPGLYWFAGFAGSAIEGRWPVIAPSAVRAPVAGG